MSKPKYTPGPWRSQGNYIFGKAVAKRVCTVNTQHIPGEESGAEEESANVALIRAAPELLDSLQRLVAYIECHRDLDEFITACDAKRVIARATGGGK